MRAAYRRTGADPPFADLTAAHGIGLEGYYWRIYEPGWSALAIAGVCPDWAMVILATSDGDVWTETVERLEEDGVDAAGDVGESEPVQAIDDALATFAADRIVIFSHPEGDRDYREDEALAAGEERWNVPVTHALISR